MSATTVARSYSGGATTISVTEGGSCRPFSTTGLRGGRVAFVDWREGRPEVVACATEGTLTLRAQPDGTLDLGFDLVFDDGSQLRGVRLPVARR